MSKHKQAEPKKKPHKLQSRGTAQKSIERFTRVLSHTSLPEIAFISSLIFGLYVRSADSQYPGEMIIPLLLFALLATALFYIFKGIIRSWLGAHFASIVLLYALYSFSHLPAWLHNSGTFLLPKHFETPFSSATASVLVIAVVAGGLGYGFVWFTQQFVVLRRLHIHRIILFGVLLLFVVQGFRVTIHIVTVHGQSSYRYPIPNLQHIPGEPITRPDIYYVVFDRYASNETLKKVYKYDNSGLTDYLAGQGFVTREDAKANYPFAIQSISATLTMHYHTDLGSLFGGSKLQTAFPYRAILQNPPIAQVLKQNGYQYNQLSSWWDSTRVDIKADGNQTKSFRLRAFGKNYYLSDFSRGIIQASVFSPWLKKGISFGTTTALKYDNDTNLRENFFNQVRALKTLASQTHEVPQFSFAHILVPRDPYIFDKNGSVPPYNGGRNDYGLDEGVKYTNEITYLNTQIKDLVGSIRLHSPNAVIVIQSAGGPYPKEFRFAQNPSHYYNPSNLPLDQEKQIYGVLASYYMPGVDAGTVQKNITSSVNPFRFILKQYLGYDIAMLPDCQFATGDKFVLYSFENETPKLQNNPAAACNSL